MTRRHTVSDVNEEQLLRPMLEIFDAHNHAMVRDGTSRLLLGPGDDCAIYDQSRGRTVVTIDTQTQGQDYLMSYPCGYDVDGFDLGWKSAAQNLADVAAMGAVPTGLVISLSLPPQTPLEMVRQMALGYCAAIRRLGASGCTVGGGDVGSGTELSASVAAFGLVGPGTEKIVPGPGLVSTALPAVLRSGARPGDLVVLAGTVGRAAAGLDVLLHENGEPPLAFTDDATGDLPWAAPSDSLAALAACQLRPLPPLALSRELSAAGATAMIDVSDGLVMDAGRIARASGVGIELDTQALGTLCAPLQKAADLVGKSPLDWALAGGEDHGILACLPSTARLPDGVIAIGSCRESDDREPQVSVDGRTRENKGWDHFAAKDWI
ncbi:thiamine-phosphate kinase [Rothia uropygialis]|uniref:thiamine-phosphate kinase n=1 Tax=Kocuria sp. 36 TaxID=1415402 RepID=UPI001EE7F837|nr:thiamine-phosphate kinase [Kocuria sp. 36]